jgi:predicted RNA binding protein YcfA (HicA-like mRNA interferase family)
MSDTGATLFGVKVSEVLRLIGKDGWYLDRQREAIASTST